MIKTETPNQPVKINVSEDGKVIIGKSYKLTYVTAHGNKPTDKTVIEGYKLKSDDLPELEESGYTFKGWYNGSTKIEVEYTVTSNLTLTASWEEASAYSYVDLGLASGTKWMTCNLGATQPYEYGDYYAWGETEPYYDSITWSGTDPSVTWKSGKSDGYADDFSNYKFTTDGGSTFTKYNGTDGKTELETGTNGDDAIWIATNGRYKLPTKAQQEELLNTFLTYNEEEGRYEFKSGSSAWVSDYQGTGVAGITITGNGNTMFIPSSGCFYGDSVYDVGDVGSVWSSALNTGDVSAAWGLYSYSEGAFENSYCIRYCGFALRGVLV